MEVLKRTTQDKRALTEITGTPKKPCTPTRIGRRWLTALNDRCSKDEQIPVPVFQENSGFCLSNNQYSLLFCVLWRGIVVSSNYIVVFLENKAEVVGQLLMTLLNIVMGRFPMYGPSILICFLFLSTVHGSVVL